jgi:hypothetical protein
MLKRGDGLTTLIGYVVTTRWGRRSLLAGGLTSRDPRRSRVPGNVDDRHLHWTSKPSGIGEDVSVARPHLSNGRFPSKWIERSKITRRDIDWYGRLIADLVPSVSVCPKQAARGLG